MIRPVYTGCKVVFNLQMVASGKILSEWVSALLLNANSAQQFFSYIMARTSYIMCYFSAKLSALRGKSKDWLAQNQDYVSDWGDKSIYRLLF
jgi:hypothetical protein